MNILEEFAKVDFQRKDLPIWIRRLNYIAFIPILFWPLIFFGTIFFFDNPKNILLTFLLFLAVNSYPFVIGGLVLASYRLFPKNKFLSVLPPMIPIGVMAYGFFVFFASAHWWWQK